MMIEVLGTVLGTAIQGQIVGGKNCSADADAANGTNVSKVSVSTVSLEESVSVETPPPSVILDDVIPRVRQR